MILLGTVMFHTTTTSSSTELNKLFVDDICSGAEEGVCRPNSPLVKKIQKKMNVSECCMACSTEPKCVTWILGQKLCILRSGLGLGESGKCISGQVREVSTNSLSIPSNDPQKSVSEGEEFSKECKTSIDFKKGLCYPESRLEARVNATSPEYCCNACSDISECQTWIYNSLNHMCYLRNGQGKAKKQDACISGFKSSKTENIVSNLVSKLDSKSKSKSKSNLKSKSKSVINEIMLGAPADYNRPIVCFTNEANNPRTASVFSNGIFSKFVHN